VAGRGWPAVLAALVWDALAAIATVQLSGSPSNRARGQRS